MRLRAAGFFFSSRRRHTRSLCDWSSDVCSSDLGELLIRLDVAQDPAEEREAATDLVEANEELAAREARVKWIRSEERRVGKECRARGWPQQGKERRDETRGRRRDCSKSR